MKRIQFRPLAMKRLNSFIRMYSNLNYSQFISLLNKKNIVLNRKILSQLAVSEASAVRAIVAILK